MPASTTPPSLKRLWQDWCNRKPQEKNTHVAVFGLICAVGYAALLWPLTAKRIEVVTYNLAKQTQRFKTTSKAGKPLEIPEAPSSLGGKGLPEARKDLEVLQAQLGALREELRATQAQFVPLDDTLAMTALKSGLTGLAEAGDMEVLGLEHIYQRPEDKDRPPTPELIRAAAEANPFKRPLITMRARASYRGLMQFLYGLNELPYVAAPVWTEITVGVERKQADQALTRQWLEVQIRFAV